ncbi:hypothetical protein ACIRPK_24685 [Kitasatospora sp. NPDC101801]|uniref:hypothetical protein n=1 Tax=Kitasatospora sp. NPDC101801 TaxID=3364103 RepID=UPI003802F967
MRFGEAPIGFIRQYSGIELAHGSMQDVRAVVGRAPWPADVCAQFDRLLAERPLSIVQYSRATNVDFATEDDLYAYLHRVYDHLFRGADEVPIPPERRSRVAPGWLLPRRCGRQSDP